MLKEFAKKTTLVASTTEYAQKAKDALEQKYAFSSLEESEVVLVLGGDGFMLEILHSSDYNRKLIYGMNLGHVGFLLNTLTYDNLDERILKAEVTPLSPLQVKVTCKDKIVDDLIAFNDVSVLRASPQTAHLEIKVNDVIRIDDLGGDGMLVATAAGSSAYNASAGGPILPIHSDLLAITPICSFTHQRWRGAVLTGDSVVKVTNLDPEKRPITFEAGSHRFEDVLSFEVSRDKNYVVKVLFDKGHALEDRLIGLQFV